MKNKSLIVTAILFIAAVCQATTMEFLAIPVGARPTALGGAFTAVPGDPNAVLYNPAGLATLSADQAELTYGRWLDTLNYESLIYIRPLASGCLGVNLFNFHAGQFDETDLSGPMGSVITYGDFAVTAGYGRNFGKFNAGGSLKFAVSGLAGSYAYLYALSAGGTFKTLIPKLEKDLILSLVLNNLGPAVKFESAKETVPSNLDLGLYSLLIDLRNHAVGLSADFVQPFSKDLRPTFSAGVEYSLFRILSLRLGYKFNTDLNGLTTGLGIDYYNMSFNYSLYSFGELGLTHIISINLKPRKIVAEIRRQRLESAVDRSYAQKDFNTAIILSRELLIEDPRNARAENCLRTVRGDLNGLIRASLEKGNWDEARRHMDTLKKIDPTNAAYKEKEKELVDFQNDNTPPLILVNNLSENNVLVIDGETGRLTGRISENVWLKEVVINERVQELLDGREFILDKEVDLRKQNVIQIIATDLKGNRSEKFIEIRSRDTSR